MISLGLLGKSISHSRSSEIYRELLKKEIDYKLFDYNTDKEIPSLDFFFNQVSGLSITSPYKKHFFNQVALAQDLPSFLAINCVKKKEGGGYLGTNTDYFAILEILPTLLASRETEIILLGDGVMADITILALKKMQLKYSQYSRKLTHDFITKDFSKVSSKTLFINTCSRDYVFKNKIRATSIFWDYNYSFPPHQLYPNNAVGFFLDGFTMLKKQAEYALKFWQLT